MNRLTGTGLLLLGLLLAACTPAPQTGTLSFVANGEDFARQGFTSGDGWALTFDHVYITLGDITAYQTDPPYDADSGTIISGEPSVNLPGPVTVDLAGGAADRPLVGQVTDAPAGHYNALRFTLTAANDGPAAGDVLALLGRAQKDGETVDFTLSVQHDLRFSCGEYVGDERKGILNVDGSAELEMTFHFDHLFGDGSLPADDDLNRGALGFDPLAALADDGVITADLTTLQARLSPDDYATLISILPTLGHTGEGHCHESPLD